jgi:DNA-binding MarR family transcriptional regulator
MVDDTAIDAAFNLPLLQTLCLRQLRISSAPRTLGDLAIETSTTPTYMSQVLVRLRADGRVRIVEENGRRKTYQITDAGDQALRGHFRLMRALDPYAQPNGHGAPPPGRAFSDTWPPKEV